MSAPRRVAIGGRVLKPGRPRLVGVAAGPGWEASDWSRADILEIRLDHFPEVRDGVAALGRPGIRVWGEPGRALVAQGVSVVVQVQHRRGAELFINDGIYGSLSDAGAPGFRFPVRLVGRQSDAA
ncbi:MAG TPA: hypothetical protein PKN80_08875, partial [bacterium]|nr:hypothetical protein [bacterium]